MLIVSQLYNPFSSQKELNDKKKRGTVCHIRKSKVLRITQ